jgi:sensor histidine kinase YesM
MIAGIALSVVLGSAAGVALGMTLTGHGLEQWTSEHALQALLIGLMFGIGVSYLFYSRERMGRLESELKARELREAQAERARLDARLRMLQAQIEPHFLFNTLANLAVLIRSDPARAERLLGDLIAWLRATLQRTREADSTLGDEIELLRRYLDILGLRLGPRLRVAFDVPPALLSRPFPLLLLQPLVENAVTHGIEPQVEGGELRIAAGEADGRLRLTVSDTGAGLGAGGAGAGFGLESVRQRLGALFGEAARLDVRSNTPRGVIATLEIPA